MGPYREREVTVDVIAGMYWKVQLKQTAGMELTVSLREVVLDAIYRKSKGMGEYRYRLGYSLRTSTDLRIVEELLTETIREVSRVMGKAEEKSPTY